MGQPYLGQLLMEVSDLFSFLCAEDHAMILFLTENRAALFLFLENCEFERRSI